MKSSTNLLLIAFIGLLASCSDSSKMKDWRLEQDKVLIHANFPTLFESKDEKYWYKYMKPYCVKAGWSIDKCKETIREMIKDIEEEQEESRIAKQKEREEKRKEKFKNGYLRDHYKPALMNLLKYDFGYKEKGALLVTLAKIVPNFKADSLNAAFDDEGNKIKIMLGEHSSTWSCLNLRAFEGVDTDNLEMKWIPADENARKLFETHLGAPYTKQLIDFSRISKNVTSELESLKRKLETASKMKFEIVHNKKYKKYEIRTLEKYSYSTPYDGTKTYPIANVAYWYEGKSQRVSTSIRFDAFRKLNLGQDFYTTIISSLSSEKGASEWYQLIRKNISEFVKHCDESVEVTEKYSVHKLGYLSSMLDKLSVNCNGKRNLYGTKTLHVSFQ